MTYLVRAAGLHGYEALATSLGVHAGAELQRVGLSAGALENPDALIPYLALINLLERTAVVGSCPTFGLQLAQRQDIGILGPLAILIRHAPTVSDAIALASRYMFVHNPAVRLAVLPVPGQPAVVDLSLSLEMPHLPPCVQTLELSLAILAQCWRVLRQGVGDGHSAPLLARLPHARMGAPSDYVHVFHCPCEFDAPAAVLRVRSADLQLPMPEHNAMLQELAESYLKQHFEGADRLFSDRVRAVLRHALGSGEATQQAVAHALAVHARTLQRRLASEGFRFEDMLDALRRERFVELLARNPPVGLAQLALMLGYSEQATLTRSCRRWFGCTPSELLQRQRTRHDDPL